MTATCGAVVTVTKVAAGARPFRLAMRRCGAPATKPAGVVNDEHGPIYITAACPEHGGAAALTSTEGVTS